MKHINRGYLSCCFLIFIVFPFTLSAQVAPVANFSASITSSCGSGIIKFTDLSTNKPTSWLWEFGGGVPNATVKNPIINFSAPGIYTIKLTATNASGSNSTSKINYITINPLPVPAFTASVTNACVPVSTLFTDQSTPGSGATISKWNWNFGDGSAASAVTNPNHSYTTPGTYQVTLVVTDSKGCSKIGIKTGFITVNPKPNPVFSATSAFNCTAPFSANFTTSDAGTGAAYSWKFGDGQTAAVRTPVNTYAAPGAYTVSLVTTTGAGCKDSLTKTNYINISSFVPDFKSDLQKQCVTIPVKFTDLSTPTASSFSWDFGDGTTSTAQSPTHSYSTAGTYTVTLTAVDATGCSKIAKKTNYIKIDPKPVIGFTATSVSECAVPTTITFKDTTAGASKWNWTFASNAFATAQNPQFTYTTAGIYPVSVKVTDVNGCIDSLTKNNLIKIVFPKANFVANKLNGCVPLPVQFTDQSVSTETITKWTWNFGDKTPVSTVQNPFHNYVDTGVFDVTLIIQNAKGCIDSIRMKKYISPGKPPVVAFSGTPSLGCFPLHTVFTDASSSYADTWQWSFGDGTNSALKNPNHGFSDTGFFAVSLTASFHNCPATVNKPKYVYVQAPQALFTSTNPVGCVFPYNVTFTDQSKGPKTWAWDFGDPTSGVNNTSSLKSPPVHQYKNPGFYTVKLTVTDPGTGCSNTITKAGYVKISLIQHGFTTGSQVGCQPFNVTFTDTTKTNTSVANWQWFFNDGYVITGSGNIPAGINPDPVSGAAQTSGTYQVPKHIYSLPGKYSIKLVVTDQLGCNDTLIKPPFLVVKQLPLTKFGADKLTGCAPLPVTFTDSSTGPAPITNWLWRFGDGDTSIVKNPPPHTYKIRGVYTVSLVVTDNQSCAKLVTKTIVPTFPVPDFTIDSVACNKKAVTIVNKSTEPNSPLTYVWDFGDGSPASTLTNPPHTYVLATSGNLNVKLTATDKNGCFASKTSPLVYSRPVAYFKASTTFANCPPIYITFTDSSYSQSTAKDKIKSRLWNFGDPLSLGSNTNKDSLKPSHSYNLPNKYDVSLIVSNTYGCIDTAFKPKFIYVGGPTLTAMDFNPKNNVCPPFDVTFTVTGKNIASYQWVYGDATADSIPAKPNVPNVIKHTYTSAGTYKPILTLTDSVDATIPNSKACSITFPPLTDPIVVLGPVVDFDNGNSDSAFFCNPVDINFSNNSDLSSLDTWLWDFGDNTSSTDPTPAAHHYATPGSYAVSLQGTNTAAGCSFKKTKKNNITIFTPAPIKFTMSDSMGCIPLLINFKPVPTTVTLPLLSWCWKFGNGDTLLIKDSTQNYSKFNTPYSYKLPGSFRPTFTVQFKKYLCYVKYDLNNKVFTLGKPFVTFDQAPVIQGNSINTFAFTNTSAGTTSFQWTFGDGGTSTLENPTHTYMAAGTFPVTLLAKNVLGCTDTISRKVKATDGLNIGNAFTPNGDGINDKFMIDLPGVTITKFSIEIFDRWGNLVYESADYKNDWDGKDMNNKALIHDTYYYVLKYNDHYSWNGYVTILKSE